MTDAEKTSVPMMPLARLSEQDAREIGPRDGRDAADVLGRPGVEQGDRDHGGEQALAHGESVGPPAQGGHDPSSRDRGDEERGHPDRQPSEAGGIDAGRRR